HPRHQGRPAPARPPRRLQPPPPPPLRAGARARTHRPPGQARHPPRGGLPPNVVGGARLKVGSSRPAGRQLPAEFESVTSQVAFVFAAEMFLAPLLWVGDAGSGRQRSGWSGHPARILRESRSSPSRG